MSVVRFSLFVIFSLAVATASSAAGQTAAAAQSSQTRLEIMGEYGGHYWIVETAADGSRRGAWISKQTPLDRIDRSILQPIAPLRTQQPTTTPAMSSSPAPVAGNIDDRLARIEHALANLTTPSVTPQAVAVEPTASAPTQELEQARTQQTFTPTRRHPQTREGFWFNAGMGLGLAGCQGCFGRNAGASGGLSLGGRVSDKVLLGVGTSGWVRSYGDGSTLTGGTTDARVRFYPSLASGFFITGGLGIGHISASVGNLSASEVGVGALFGLGWDVRIGRNVSLTPFYNGFAVSTPNADGHVDQFGLGITVH